jgi:hypothetical protein
MALYDNLSQQYSGFTDPFGFREEEEEDAVGNARPVTQTVKTNPVTGEQTMTIKGSPYDLSAANPLTPTVAQPVQPSGAGAFLGGYEDMAPPMAPPMGMAPQMGQAPPMPAVDNRNIVPLEQPAAGGYDPEQMAQVLQQAGLNYQQPQPIATLAQAGMSDANPPVIPQQPQPSGAGGFLGGYEDMAPAPVAPAALVAPSPAAAAPAAPPAAAVAPGSDEYTQTMLAELRKREGNYDSPPHSASSAQGAYGITAPAYSDIQRADPYFANRPQGQLSPADQDRAALVLRGLNQQRLQSQGVEPTEANQQLAHFLGPKGAADYLSSGYISPEAAAANGGVEKVRQIAEERLALGRQLSGQVGPAVAGVGREMGMGEPGYGGGDVTPQARQFQSVQNDKQGLITMLANPNLDPATRRVAETQLGDLYRNDKEMAAAEKAANAALTGKNGGLALDRLIKKEGDEGSYIKAYIYARLGLTELAREEQQKLGAGDKWISTMIDGKSAYVKFNAQGLPVAGVGQDGDLSKDDLLRAANRGKVSTAAEFLEAPNKQILRSQVDEKGNAQLVDVATGEKYTGPSLGLKPMREGVKMREMDYGVLTSLKKKHGGNVLDALKEYQTSVGPLNDSDRNEFLKLYGYATGSAAPGAVTPPPGAVAPPPGAVAPPPGAVAPVTPVAPGAVPTATPTSPGLSTPISQLQTGTAVTKAEQAAFVAKEGTKEQIGTSANDGMAVANIRRQQMDIVKNNPSIINILNGQGTQYDRARRLMVNAVTGSYGNEDKKQLADELNQLVNKLNPGEYGALQEFLNQNTVVNAKTLRANSGPGAVSEAEQRANKEANIGNIDRIETYAALAGLNRSQFTGDLNASKQAFLASRPDIKTTSQWNSEWQKRESEMVKQYQAIAKGRFEVMGKPPKATAAPAEMSAYRDRVFRAFEVYPAPKFDPATNKWDYVTANAKRAAMSAILGN